MKIKSKIKWSDFIIIGLVVILVSLLIWVIVSQIREQYLQDDPMLYELRDRLSSVHPSVKNITLLRGNRSYTINKEKVYLCLRDKDGNYYSKNTLTYVFLHELAHVLNDEVGHTEKFHTIFEGLLDTASKQGVFNPSIPIEPDYCTH